MIDEFNEADRPKISLAKYFVEFNDPLKTRLRQRTYLRLLGKPYTLLYEKKSIGRLINER